MTTLRWIFQVVFAGKYVSGRLAEEKMKAPRKGDDELWLQVIWNSRGSTTATYRKFRVILHIREETE